MRMLFSLQETGWELPTSAIGGIVLLAMGFLVFLLGAYRGPSLLRSAGLLVVLLGYFVTLTSLLWRLGEESPGGSTAVLLGAVAVFRLMASFEQPPRNSADQGGKEGGRVRPPA